jgi:hypothetical protein
VLGEVVLVAVLRGLAGLPADLAAYHLGPYNGEDEANQDYAEREELGVGGDGVVFA